MDELDKRFYDNQRKFFTRLICNEIDFTVEISDPNTLAYGRLGRESSEIAIILESLPNDFNLMVRQINHLYLAEFICQKTAQFFPNEYDKEVDAINRIALCSNCEYQKPNGFNCACEYMSALTRESLLE